MFDYIAGQQVYVMPNPGTEADGSGHVEPYAGNTIATIVRPPSEDGITLARLDNFTGIRTGEPVGTYRQVIHRNFIRPIKEEGALSDLPNGVRVKVLRTHFPTESEQVGRDGVLSESSGVHFSRRLVVNNSSNADERVYTFATRVALLDEEVDSGNPPAMGRRFVRVLDHFGSAQEGSVLEVLRDGDTYDGGSAGIREQIGIPTAPLPTYFVRNHEGIEVRVIGPLVNQDGSALEAPPRFTVGQRVRVDAASGANTSPIMTFYGGPGPWEGVVADPDNGEWVRVRVGSQVQSVDRRFVHVIDEPAGRFAVGAEVEVHGYLYRGWNGPAVVTRDGRDGYDVRRVDGEMAGREGHFADANIRARQAAEARPSAGMVRVERLREVADRAVRDNGPDYGEDVFDLVSIIERGGFTVSVDTTDDYYIVDDGNEETVAQFRDRAEALAYVAAKPVLEEVPFEMIERIVTARGEEQSWCGAMGRALERLRPVTDSPAWTEGAVTNLYGDRSTTATVQRPGVPDVTVATSIDQQTGQVVVTVDGVRVHTTAPANPMPF